MRGLLGSQIEIVSARASSVLCVNVYRSVGVLNVYYVSVPVFADAAVDEYLRTKHGPAIWVGFLCMYVCVPDLHTAPCRDQWGMQRSVCSYQHTLKLSWQRTLFSDLDMKKNIGQLKAVLEFETHGPKSLHYCLSWSYRCHKISSGHLWITTLAYKLSVVSI